MDKEPAQKAWELPPKPAQVTSVSPVTKAKLSRLNFPILPDSAVILPTTVAPCNVAIPSLLTINLSLTLIEPSTTVISFTITFPALSHFKYLLSKLPSSRFKKLPDSPVT